MIRCTQHLLLLVMSLALAAQATEAPWRYPYKISTLSDLECGCWDAIDRQGKYPTDFSEDYVIAPDIYLVDAPPTMQSAISITTDRWIEVAFAGPIVDVNGPDIRIREEGQSGETALVFLSDGRSRTYPLGIASIPNLSAPYSTICEFDISQVDPGFVPTAIRIVSLGLGGGSPGFDVGSVEARIGVDMSRPYLPHPYDGTDGTKPTQALQWYPSSQTTSVDVYLGTDSEAANPSAAAAVASLPGDANRFEPPTLLKLGRTYYWRIVEHHNNETRIGDLWEFTVSPYVEVDSFESYAHTGELPWYSYMDGIYSLSHGDDVVYQGCHGIALHYDCSEGQQNVVSRFYYTANNWADPNLGFVEISFRGLPSNPAGHVIFFGMGALRRAKQITYNGNPNHIRDGQWHTWRIPLTNFQYLNIIDVIEFGVQASDDTLPTQSTGTVYFDEIRLSSEDAIWPNVPLPLRTDLNHDKQLNPEDLALFSDGWLATDQDTLAVQEPNAPWCHLSFDDSISDAQGNALVSPTGSLRIDNQYAEFKSPDTSIRITNAQALSQFTQGVTVSFWQSGEPSIHRTDTLVCSDFSYPEHAPELAIGLGLWERPEALYWQCGRRQNPGNLLTGIHQVPEQWSQRWNHWAFTKDFSTGRMAVYLNGKQFYEGRGQATGLKAISTLEIGNGWYGFYDGLMDDLRIHNYALNARECAYLATNGTGTLPQPAILPSDFNKDGQVDWQDFAVMAGEWMDSM